MRENYLPWQVSVSDFPKDGDLRDQFIFLLSFAILAPSGHNSQPWAFKIENNSVLIFAESSRHLVKSDTNGRQLYISLGCAIENIVIAADYYGFSTAVTLLPDSKNQDLAARVTFSRASEKTSDKDHLIFSIPERFNNRSMYENRVQPKEVLNTISQLQTTNLSINFFISEQKNIAADVAIEAGITAMDNKDFREELSGYVKNNFTSSKVGMPAFGMGIPTLVSLLVPTMIKRFNINRMKNKQDKALLKKFTPIIGVISTEGDVKPDWLNAGRIYERIALMAVSNGFCTAVWASPIQIADYYRKLQSILRTNFRPQVFFRMGYSGKNIPHSPRLSVEEVLIR